MDVCTIPSKDFAGCLVSRVGELKFRSGDSLLGGLEWPNVRMTFIAEAPHHPVLGDRMESRALVENLSPKGVASAKALHFLRLVTKSELGASRHLHLP